MSEELEFLDEEVRNALQEIIDKAKRKITINVRANADSDLWAGFEKILKFFGKSSKIKVKIEKVSNIEEGMVIVDLGNIEFFGIPSGDLFGVFMNTVYLLTGGITFDDLSELINPLKKKRGVIMTMAGEECPHCVNLSFYTNIIAHKVPTISHIIVNVDSIPDGMFKLFYEKYFKPYNINYVPIQILLEDPNDLLSGRIFMRGGEEYFEVYVKYLSEHL